MPGCSLTTTFLGAQNIAPRTKTTTEKSMVVLMDFPDRKLVSFIFELSTFCFSESLFKDDQRSVLPLATEIIYEL